jgi:nodulation protein E
MRRVAVTGLGAITALGPDAASLWSAVSAGRCGIARHTGLPPPGPATAMLAAIPEFDATAHFDRRQLVKLDRATRFALVAAREAMADVDLAAHDRTRCGAILGATMGQTTLEDSYRALYAEAAPRLPPLTVPRVMPNAPASQVAMAFGLQGACFATASACASATHAIGLAGQMVRAGLLDLAVTGGADASLTPGYLRAWEALRVLSPDGCRPFSRDRNGLVLGEGAGVLVLEAWDLAVARGATILGEFLGFGMSADAGDLTAPSSDGAARAMRAALDDARLHPAQIGYVNAHGTATRLNDRTEAAALREVFAGHLPALPVSSSKSMHGHCLAAAGGVEAVVTLQALRHGLLPPTIGRTEPDPDCALDCVAEGARPARVACALSNSFAFGGLNAVLAFGAAA